MWQRNNGMGEANTLQNHFTKFLVTSIARDKKKYMRKRAKIKSCEISVESNELDPLAGTMKELADIVALAQALDKISAKDRYILFARVFDNRKFEDIASKLGMSYKGAYSAYYRALQQLREML